MRTLNICSFGEAGLHSCEVMLRDMADSKRLDANVRALPAQLAAHRAAAQQQQQMAAAGNMQQLPADTTAALSRLRATVCSHLFWPELPQDELLLPQCLTTAMEV